METLPLARNDNSRARLLAVIEHDVKRLDRLISDISDASRLDAELQRQDMAPVDLRRLLATLDLGRQRDPARPRRRASKPASKADGRATPSRCRAIICGSGR